MRHLAWVGVNERTIEIITTNELSMNMNSFNFAHLCFISLNLYTYFIWFILNHSRWYSFTLCDFIEFSRSCKHTMRISSARYTSIIHIFIYIYNLIQLTVYPYYFFCFLFSPFYLNFYLQTLWTGSFLFNSTLILLLLSKWPS